jgi:hypothetical protein
VTEVRSQIRTELVVLGAGPHGLATAIRATEDGATPGDDLVVVDPTGGWLEAWEHSFAAYAIESLRSPGVHHPGSDPSALSSWSQANGRRSTAAYGQPFADAFSGFCGDLVRAHGLAGAVVPKRALLLSAGDGTGVSVLLDGHTLVEAERAVLATNPGRRRIPGWVDDLLPRPGGVVAHAADVDLRRFEPGGVVLVVGGGLTAAHLALGALERGADRVHLLVRRSLRISTFDTDPGWLGPKELDPFARLSPAERADAVLAARDGGSVPAGIASALRKQERTGALVIHEHARVVAGVRAERPTLVLGDERRVTGDRVWLATGTQPCVDACRLLDDVRATHPNHVHQGFPELTDDLRWPGTSLHLSGRLASLQLGPAAGNLWGARKAAERITAARSRSGQLAL